LVAFTKLRLHGFKSFAEPVELRIEPGLTGIVGPNGCGKSNLVEGLRWAMGESSARRLRGGEMDELIFAGNDKRPSRNLAEVQISLDDPEGRAPAAFNESDSLLVSRKLVRDGGSKYKINGRDARASDVRLLFADLASGAASNALVPQGKVAALIDAKPEDRRALLEEAASITGLYARRREAELRLKAAQRNLERLDDLRGLLSGRQRGLRSQARAAQRYQELEQRIRQIAVTLALSQWQEAEALRSACEAERASSAQEASQRERERLAAERELEQQEIALEAQRQAEQQARVALQRLEQEATLLARDATQVEQDRQVLTARLQELALDAAREAERSEAAQQRLAALESEATELDAELTRLTPRLAALSAEVEKQSEALSQQQASLAAQQTAEALVQRQLADAEAAAQRARNRNDMARAELAGLHKTANPTDLNSEALERLAAELEAAETAQATAGRARDKAEAALTAQETALHTARQAADDTRRQRDALRSEAEGLARLLAPDPKQTGGETLRHQLQVTAGWEAAVSAALGARLDASLDAHPEAQDKQPHFRPAETRDFNWPVGIVPLASQLAAPEAASAALAGLGIAETAAQAEAAQAALLPGQSVTSRAGGLWCWDGFVIPPESQSRDANWLRQQTRAVALTAELAPLQERYAAQTAEVEAAEAARNQARSQQQQARQNLSEQETAVRAAQAALQAAQTRLYAQRQAEAEQAAQRLAAEAGMAESDRAKATADQALTAARQALDNLEAKGERQALEAAVRDAETALATNRQAVEQVQRALATARAQSGAISSRRFDWQGQAKNAHHQQQIIQKRQQESKLELDALASRPEALRDKSTALQHEIDQQQALLSQAAEDLAKQQGQTQLARQQSRTAEQSATEARNREIRAESAAEHARERSLTLAQQIEAEFGVTAQSLASEPPPRSISQSASADELNRQRDQLERERNALGSVNLAAQAELGALSEELDALNREYEDVAQALSKLRQSLNRLNRQGRKRLTETLQVVDKAFHQLFVHLFDGGKAELQLVGDDPLDAGLEVLAMPPGKTLTRLGLLSGGEQTLTATALIFAAFQANPSPICVLDEVDAPLDESNVVRFIELVRRLSEETGTRFLVVTHHGVTMAKLDRLYGVTMAERGVSQLVSLDLNAALQYQSAA
jgi:chromosome segregation protein